MSTELKGRGDIHSPANFNPEHYEYVGAFDNQPPPGFYLPGPDGPQDFTMDDGTVQRGTNWNNAHDRWLRGLVEASPTARYGDCHQCDHCGAWIRYVGIFRHLPTGDCIAAGETCADNRFSQTKSDFDRLRKAAQLDRQAQRILTVWNEYRADHSQVRWDRLDESENSFIIDVLRKGRQYGNLSERQLDAIVKAYDRDVQRAADRAVREANPIATVPVPEGKGIVIEGKMVSRKWQESDFGSVEKCLIVVTTPEGEYKVWGSIPQALYGSGHDDIEDGNRWVEDTPAADIGSTVRLTANVTRSDRDESFGFFSRPRKASVIEAAEVSS